MMKCLLLSLFLLLSAPSLASAASTYYADPAGSDTASCEDVDVNVCTLARAEARASSGDTVQAACGTYNQGGTTLTINVNITIAPVTAGCAIITGTNTTSIVTLTAANDANMLTFGAFKVQNTGGATSSTMLITNVAYDATIVLDGTSIIVGGTNRHLADQWTRGTLKLRNVNMSGTVGAQAGFYSVVTPSAAKKLSIVGGNYTLTASAGNTPAIYIERVAGSSTSEWVEVKGTTVNMTVPGTLAGGMGIRLNRITSGTNLDGDATPPLVESNTVTVTATTVTGDAFAIVSSSTDATAVADYTVIRNNVVTCNAPIARCLSIGTDSTTAFFATNALIHGNTVTNPFYNGSATPHGVQCGRVTNCSILGNRVNGFAVGIMCSIGTNCLATGNVVSGAQYAPLFAKGNTSATFANNTVIMDDTLYGAVFGGYACLGVAVQGATNNVATLFQNNLCYVRNGTNWKYTDVDASQVANFERNNYYADVSLTNPWSYQGSADATLGAWNTRATVGTDVSATPWVLTDPLP